MKRFVLTPRAEQDVSDIWDYIADDSIEAADRVLSVAAYVARVVATIEFRAIE